MTNSNYAVKKRTLAFNDLVSGSREIEPPGAVYLRKRFDLSTAGWPFNLERVAAQDRYIEVAPQGEGDNNLSASLANFTERKQIAFKLNSQFFGEFSLCGGFGIFIWSEFSLGDRPGSNIALRPKWPAWMHEENFKGILDVAIHQNSGAFFCHCVDSHHGFVGSRMLPVVHNRFTST